MEPFDELHYRMELHWIAAAGAVIERVGFLDVIMFGIESAILALSTDEGHAWPYVLVLGQIYFDTV